MMANPVGRPRTTTSDLPDDWHEIVRRCGQDGQSAFMTCIIAGFIGVDTLSDAAKNYFGGRR